MSQQEIVAAYRALYRSALRAVQFAKPQRFVVRDRLRAAFRDASQRSSFDPEAVRRTVWFLNAAAGGRGLEHRIVRNLLRTAWHRTRDARLGAQKAWAATSGLVRDRENREREREKKRERELAKGKKGTPRKKEEGRDDGGGEEEGDVVKEEPVDPIRSTAYRHYDLTIAMLNKSMRLCLR